MPAKTSQLQIRVSPAQKAALKRLAAAQGLSLSEFVLRQALPSATNPLRQWADADEGDSGVPKSLSDLTLRLRMLDDHSFCEAANDFEAVGIPELRANCAAAAVEQEATWRGLAPPAWTTTVAPMSRPWFAWRLRSLRPHLMRISSMAFKRRGVYLPASDDERRLTNPASDFARSGVERSALEKLEARLRDIGLEVELCIIGAAVLPVVFTRAPASRRPRDLFGSLRTFRSAARGIAETEGLDVGWLESSARILGRQGATKAHPPEDGGLRVFAPPAEYVLSLRCARLASGPVEERSILLADVAYLARLLGLATAEEVVTAIVPYLPESILGDTLEQDLRVVEGVTT